MADRAETASHLAERAAMRAMADLLHRVGTDGRALAARVRVVLVASVTAAEPAPAIATRVAGAIGASGSVVAMDLVLGCNGFVGALAAARGLLRDAEDGDLAVVVGAETMTRVLDATDRNTLPIFGDGAGAFVVESGQCIAAKPRIETIPDGGPRIQVARRAPALAPLLRLVAEGEGVALRREKGTPHVVQMDGRRVFRDMVRTLPGVVRSWLSDHGLTLDDFDAFAFHQANARLLEGVFHELGLPRSACLMNIDAVGNTTSASIPLLLDHAAREGRLAPGSHVLVCGFGTGYSIGITSLTWL